IEARLVSGPNQVWQSDITYFKIGDNHYYLTFIIDVFTRRVIVSLNFAGCQANPPTGVHITYIGQVLVMIPHFTIRSLTWPCLTGPADETSFYQVLKDLMGWNGSTHGVFRALEPVAQLTENPTELIAAYAFGSQLPVELFESLAGMLGPPLVDAADKPIDQLQMGRLAPEMLPDGLLAD